MPAKNIGRDARIRFWEQLKPRMRRKGFMLFDGSQTDYEQAGLLRYSSPDVRHGSQRSYMFLIYRGYQPRVEMDIYDSNDRPWVRAFYAEILHFRAAIEADFGGTLEWLGEEARYAGWRVRYEPKRSWAIQDENAWPELQEEMIDVMIRLYRATNDRVTAVDRSLSGLG